MTKEKLTGPFRGDQVGSLLRPVVLKEARAAFEAGTISKEELTNIEDQEIRRIIEKQKVIGLKAVTDGEFRRKWWHLDFIAGLTGITVFDFESAAFGMNSKMQGTYVSDRLAFSADHPFLADFQFTKKCAGEDVLAKQTIPGPNMIYLDALILSEKYKKKPVYTNLADFRADIIKTYQDALQAFYDVGCRYLQIDDTSWGALFDERFRVKTKENGFDPDELIAEFGDITEAALINKPADLHVTFHICKGNFKSQWLYSGSYEKITKRLFQIEQFAGFFLEYDDDRSGDFRPLEDLQNQQIVLGLVTSKTAKLENKAETIARIQEAAKYVPLEQICLSPQCGFASTEHGNHLSEDEQWAKLALVKEIAEEVWDSLDKS